MECYIKSMYLCVNDMARAITFYENLFEQKVLMKDEIYSIFDIHGFRLGLFAYQKMGEKHIFGSNCLPSLEVESLEILQSKIAQLELCFPLTRIGNNWVVEFIDSEGNHIEMTTPIEKIEEKKMLIRQETKNDYAEVYTLIKQAFASAEHSDGTEHDLTNALRTSDAFIPELSLVAERDDKIVGHILFTKGKVGHETVLILAPLSVHPEYQKQGIGTALIKEGHKIAKERGYSYSLVLGSETYYPRMGYIPAIQFGIHVPEGMPSDNFMAIKLQENAPILDGSVIYAKEFGI